MCGVKWLQKKKYFGVRVGDTFKSSKQCNKVATKANGISAEIVIATTSMDRSVTYKFI